MFAPNDLAKRLTCRGPIDQMHLAGQVRFVKIPGQSLAHVMRQGGFS